MSIYDEPDYYSEFLQELIDMGHIDGAALGITKLVINKGEESLSEKQRYVFQNYVIDEFTVRCSRCGDEIPWSEMYIALTDHGMCGWCSSVSERKD